MKHLLYTSLAFLMFGCVSTQYVSWPTGTLQPNIRLPDSTGSVAVNNRIKFGYSPSSHDAVRQYPNQMEAMNGCLTGFYNEVYNRKYLKYLGTSTMFMNSANGEFPAKLELSQIQSVSKNSDILVSLEMMDQFYEDQYTIEIRKKKEGDNLYSEQDVVVGKRTLKVVAGWRVYNCKSGALVDSFVTMESHFYEAEDLQRLRVTELLDQNLSNEFRNIGLRLGHSYGARVSPTNQFTYRHIYDKGSDDLERGAAQVRDEKWDQAAEIWKSALEKESNTKRKAMLYHNLAVYEERSGNQEQAKQYAKLAANHHKLGQQTQMIMGYQ